MGLLDQFASDPVAEPAVPASQPELAPAPTGILDQFVGEPAQQVRTPVNIGEEFTAGVSTGTDQLQSTLFGLSRLVGRELGIDVLEELSSEGIDRNQAEAQLFAPTVAAFSKVEDMDDFFKWAAGGLGQAIPSLALAGGTGGTGAVLARTAAARSIRNTVKQRMLRNMRRKGITGQRAENAAEKALNSAEGFRMLSQNLVRGQTRAEVLGAAAKTGGTVGVFAGSAPPIAGETDIQLQEAGIDAGFTSLLAGAAGGALETLPILRFMDRSFPGVDRAVSKAFVRDLVKGTGIQLAIEGSTEAAQEAIMLAAQAYHDQSFDFFDPENITQITDAFAAGALVGGVMGFGGETLGAVTPAIQKSLQERAERNLQAPPPELPTLPVFEMPEDSTETDFVPADNTFFEEVKGRVNAVVVENIEPAFNSIRDRFQTGVEQLVAVSPELGAIASTLAARAKDAHQEFIDGHQHIIDDAQRYAREQVEFITEQAETMFGPEREKFVAEKMAEVREQLKSVRDVLQERADQVVESLNSQIAREGISDPVVGQETDIRTEDIASQFVFGKNNTEGEQAVGFKDRQGARRLLSKLRKKFPSATDSTFEVRQGADGTFTVVLADSGQATALREDQVVGEAFERARKATRTNEARAKEAASIQRTGVKGRTLIDVRTLVFEGRKLGEGDNQTSEQAFSAVVASALDRGIISEASAKILTDKFNDLFNARQRRRRPKRPQDRKEPASRDATEVNRDFEQLTPQQKKTINEAIDGRLNEEGLTGEDRAERRQQLLAGALQNIDAQLAGDEDAPPTAGATLEEVGEQGDEAAFIESGDGRKLESEAQQAARASSATPAKARGKRPGKKKVKRKFRPAKIEVETVNDKRRKAISRLKAKAKKDGALSEEDQTALERLEADLAASEDKILRQSKKKKTSKKKRTTQRARPTGDENVTAALDRVAGKRIAAVLPGIKPSVVKALNTIINKLSKLFSKNIRVRIINEEARRRMINEGHPEATRVTMLEPNEFSILYDPIDVDRQVVWIMVDDFSDLGASMRGLLHEIGHALHFDTWGNLSAENQNKLWDAFVADVESGFRTTGAVIAARGSSSVGIPNAQVNIFEFREWMADKFVDWMLQRKQPKNAVERFFEAVAEKIDRMYEVLVNNAGRFEINTVDLTFGQFVDAVALGIKNADPTGTNTFYVNENAGGRPLASLMEGTLKELPDPPRGVAPTEWQAITKRFTEQYPVIAKRTKLITDWLHNAYHLVLAPSTSVMREIGDRVPAALKLVSIFNREEHGVAKKSQNYHQRLKLMKGQFLEARYVHLTRGMTDADKTKLLKRLRSLDGTNRKPGSPKEQRMRQLFDDMHDYMREAGLPVGRIQNYFPKIFSRESLVNNEERIVKHFENRFKKDFARLSKQERAEQSLQGNTPLEAARSFYNSLISQEADEAAALRELQKDELSMQSPSFRNMRSRAAGDPFLDQFLENNLDGVMGNYIVSAVKRAEFNRLLGSKAPAALSGGDTLPKKIWNPQAKMDDIFDQARREGATKEDLKKMKNYIDANLGMFGRDDISDRTRTALAAVVAYNNMRVLLFTVFASLPDLVGPAIRSGSMRGAFKTTIKNIRGIIKNEGDLADMARAFGAISSTANQHVLTEYVDNHFMPPTLRKWNEAFFKWTGLNYYTDVTRKMALAVGIDSIKTQAARAEDAGLTQKQRDRAKQFLAELGLTADSVNVWVEQGERTWGGIGYDQESANDQKIAEALLQFVDESIMSPNASQRPILASHPGAMLVFHLKGFIYAMHDTILKRLAHNFNIADTPAQVLAAVSPAILMLALTAFGLELRELVTGDQRTNRMDGWDYTWTVMERSGLLGITQLGFDFESAGARGQAELAALSGPAVGQLGDLISKPASQTIPKAIPIVSQLPWARDALRAATPLGN